MRIGKYKVKFKHNMQKGTICLIIDPDTDDVIATGTSRKHPHDIYCKAIGRKLSFTRAIAEFGRSTRTDMWIDFLHTVNL
ncbi:MAG: hypothetical protein KAH10_08620 [Flavobacteriales bacterium]|nr:hypothetical protein [Flavobacteriales bacterium]